MSDRIVPALVLSLAAVSGAARAATPSVGSPAPDFELSAVDGTGARRLSVEARKNAETVLIFVSTRCPYSNGYDDRMAALDKIYREHGVRVIGINSNVNEPVKEVASHAKEHHFEFPILKDAASKVADLYGASHTPEVFVVDREGVVRYHGRIDENAQDAGAVKSPDLKNALDALLAGRPVPAAETKAFGCSIKRP